MSCHQHLLSVEVGFEEFQTLHHHVVLLVEVDVLGPVRGVHVVEVFFHFEFIDDFNLLPSVDGLGLVDGMGLLVGHVGLQLPGVVEVRGFPLVGLEGFLGLEEDLVPRVELVDVGLDISVWYHDVVQFVVLDPG